MAVADAGVIDQIVRVDGGRLTLVIQVPLTWYHGGQEQLDQLVAKINSYLAWIDSGQCVTAYPDAADGVDILVVGMDEPTGKAATMLLSAKSALVQKGIGLFYQAAVEQMDVQ